MTDNSSVDEDEAHYIDWSTESDAEKKFALIKLICLSNERCDAKSSPGKIKDNALHTAA